MLFLVYYTLFNRVLYNVLGVKTTVSLSLASSDKARLVSAVPDYFFVLGLATMTEAVSEEKKDSPHHHGIASSSVHPDKPILNLPSE